jgi:hypothetical protein
MCTTCYPCGIIHLSRNKVLVISVCYLIFETLCYLEIHILHYRKHSVPVTMIIPLVLFRKAVAVYCHAKHMNTLSGQNAKASGSYSIHS